MMFQVKLEMDGGVLRDERLIEPVHHRHDSRHVGVEGTERKSPRQNEILKSLKLPEDKNRFRHVHDALRDRKREGQLSETFQNFQLLDLLEL